MVKAKVDEELCPEIFKLGEDGKSHVIAQECDSAG